MARKDIRALVDHIPSTLICGLDGFELDALYRYIVLFNNDLNVGPAKGTWIAT